MLSFISLEQGSSDLRSALRTFDHHGPIALEACRRHGLEGFALVSLYGPVLEALGDALPLDQSLILLRVNADYIDELLQTHRPETVAGHLRHVAAAGLTAAVGGSPQALRLVVEFGDLGRARLQASRGRRGGRRLRRFHRCDPAPSGGGRSGCARLDGPGDARQVCLRPRLSRDPPNPWRGNHPADRAGRRRARNTGLSRGQDPAVVHRVVGPGGSLCLGR